MREKGGRPVNAVGALGAHDTCSGRPLHSAAMTLKDSVWLMSIVVPHSPYFSGQPNGAFAIRGCGLFVDTPGNYVHKPMTQATDQEILTEWMHHLGFDQVRRTTTVIPVMMPYITSEFQRRDVGDRPLVIPPGAKTLALIGQYVETSDDVVFTAEDSVRGVMRGVYGLLGLRKEIPPIYHGSADRKVTLASLKTLMV